jgi:hypothetical protein
MQKQNYEAELLIIIFSAREHFWSFYNFAFSKRLVRFYFLFLLTFQTCLYKSKPNCSMLSKGNPIQDNQHLNWLVVTLVKN